MVEPEPKLRAILASIAGCQLIGNDWMTVAAHQVSHVDLVVMNPPFSADERHILHAWDVAPLGCEIVALCNWSTLDPYHRHRRCHELMTLIEQYGDSEHLGPVFATAERQTDVTVGLVRLRKPGCRPGADEFDGFFLGPDDVEAEGTGLIRYRRSRELVNRYVEACRIFEEQLAAGVRLQQAVGGIHKGELALQVTVEGCPATRNRYRKDLQKAFWRTELDEMLPQAMATSGLAADINRFVEQQEKVLFTERNIYRMLQIIAGTQQQRVDRAVEEVFDTLTKHTHENRWNVEGWKTNSQYLFGKKFIIPYLVELEWSGSGVGIKHGTTRNNVTDLLKAMCFLTGRRFEDVEKPSCGFYRISTGQWHQWGFFDFKVYKKGTGHFRFRDLEDWAVLNQRIARIKGLTLPEDLSSPASRRSAS
jgi:hypothetical protein